MIVCLFALTLDHRDTLLKYPSLVLLKSIVSVALPLNGLGIRGRPIVKQYHQNVQPRVYPRWSVGYEIEFAKRLLTRLYYQYTSCHAKMSQVTMG